MANFLETAIDTFIDQFVYDQCDIGPELLVSQDNLYRAFLKWWKGLIGMRPPVRRLFDRLIRKRYQVLVANNVSFYHGLCLVDWRVNDALNGRR